MHTSLPPALSTGLVVGGARQRGPPRRQRRQQRRAGAGRAGMLRCAATPSRLSRHSGQLSRVPTACHGAAQAATAAVVGARLSRLSGLSTGGIGFVVVDVDVYSHRGVAVHVVRVDVDVRAAVDLRMRAKG